MPEPLDKPILAPGRLAGQERDGFSFTEMAGAAAGLLWLVIVALSLWLGDGDSEGGLVYTVVIVVPVVLIGLFVMGQRTILRLEGEVDALRTMVEGLRIGLMHERQNRSAGIGVDPAARAAAMAAAPAAAPARLVPPPPELPYEAPQRQAPPPAVIRRLEEQKGLAASLSDQEQEQPLDLVDLVFALNFPENEDDVTGFAALRRALRNRHARTLIQSAQDILTLLSQDGIYMDDLRPDYVHYDIWRTFARGGRGAAIDGIMAINDPALLDRTRQRMREDTIFRDTAQHFLRLFDGMLREFDPAADDEVMAAMSETRTARAFMLLGSVAGTFS